MRTSHDDRPHPIPPMAYMRWKENYFFVIICHEQNVFGVAHISNEPIFGRSRYACALSVNGRQFTYKNEAPIPEDFGESSEVGDGQMTMRVIRSHEELTLKVEGDDFTLDANFTARMPSFEFGACRYGAPENYSFKEAMTFGTNVPYEHMQQAMTVSGELRLGDAETIALDGYGYRDHSWGMRTDNAVAWHTWTGLNFPGLAFGIMDLEMLGRPGAVCKEGYVADADGVRILRKIEVIREGEGDYGLPDRMVWDVTDADGGRFVIRADIAGRMADVHHENEKGQKAGSAGYSMTETFCRLTLDGGDAAGIGLVEVGHASLAS